MPLMNSRKNRKRMFLCRLEILVMNLNMLGLVDAMRRASIVVLQGGWGTISEAIFLKKRIVAIPRRVGQECHHPQEEVVRYLEKLGCLIGCYNTAELPNLIEKARRIEFKTLSRGNAAQYINPFLDNIK